jgi:integrase
MSLGVWPDMSLAKARARHASEYAKVKSDAKIDPLAQKRAAKQEAAARSPTGMKPTFGEIADAYVAEHEAAWRSAKHGRDWRRTLDVTCAAIRDMPVDEIDTAAVLSVLQPIWRKTPETASRARARIETVIAAAQVAGHIDQNRANPARWKHWLDKPLPNPKKVGGPRGHHAAMPYAQVPAFMAKLGEDDSIVAPALAFLILTGARTGEARGATWTEIDLDAGLWTIPAKRMKAGREHRVPLSAPALDLLHRQHKARGKNPHVFPGRLPRQSLGVVALARAMRRLGAGEYTPHGFRSAFRDWAGDKTHFPREVAEAALAHAVGDATEAAYRRGDALEKRRDLMEAWARFCIPTEAKVVPITAGKKR